MSQFDKMDSRDRFQAIADDMRYALEKLSSVIQMVYDRSADIDDETSHLLLRELRHARDTMRRYQAFYEDKATEDEKGGAVR